MTQFVGITQEGVQNHPVPPSVNIKQNRSKNGHKGLHNQRTDFEIKIYLMIIIKLLLYYIILLKHSINYCMMPVISA